MITDDTIEMTEDEEAYQATMKLLLKVTKNKIKFRDAECRSEIQTDFNAQSNALKSQYGNNTNVNLVINDPLGTTTTTDLEALKLVALFSTQIDDQSQNVDYSVYSHWLGQKNYVGFNTTEHITGWKTDISTWDGLFCEQYILDSYKQSWLDEHSDEDVVNWTAIFNDVRDEVSDDSLMSALAKLVYHDPSGPSIVKTPIYTTNDQGESVLDHYNITITYNIKTRAVSSTTSTTGSLTTTSASGTAYLELDGYDISDDLVSKLASIITNETGGADLTTCLKLASQMCNYAEKLGYAADDEGLTVVAGSGIYPASYSEGYTTIAKQAVETVVKNGHRYLPRYVTVYDIITNIETAEDNYSKGTTITNKDDLEYLFYSYINSDSTNLLGYYAEDYTKYSSDDSNMKTSNANELVEYAKTFLGVPYVYGGTTPDGFDCSGFVQYVYNHFGISIPRVADDQMNDSQSAAISQMDQLQPGDLVFFGTDGYASHVGIYIGNGEMIHSPSAGDVIKTTNINNSTYYVNRFICGKRYSNVSSLAATTTETSSTVSTTDLSDISRNSVSAFEADAVAKWVFPVTYDYYDVTGAARYFGATRSSDNRVHAAIDIYPTDEQQHPFYAITDGVVKDYYYFYDGTYALEVESADGSIIRYGEISSSLGAGDVVKQGQEIGTVIYNTNGTLMLHLELYMGDSDGALTQSNSTYKYVSGTNYSRRSDLLDPTFITGCVHTDGTAGVAVSSSGNGAVSFTSGETLVDIADFDTAAEKDEDSITNSKQYRGDYFEDLIEVCMKEFGITGTVTGSTYSGGAITVEGQTDIIDVVYSETGSTKTHSITPWDNIYWSKGSQQVALANLMGAAVVDESSLGVLYTTGGNVTSDNGLIKYGGYYAVATTSSFGDIGQVNLIVQDDGTIYPVIMVDQAAQEAFNNGYTYDDNPANYWGHVYGNTTCVVEFEITYSAWKSGVNSASTINPNLNHDIMQIVQLGNIFQNEDWINNLDQALEDMGYTQYRNNIIGWG